MRKFAFVLAVIIGGWLAWPGSAWAQEPPSEEDCVDYGDGTMVLWSTFEFETGTEGAGDWGWDSSGYTVGGSLKILVNSSSGYDNAPVQTFSRSYILSNIGLADQSIDVRKVQYRGRATTLSNTRYVMHVYDADGMDSVNDVSSAWDLLQSPYVLIDFDRLEVKATYNPVGSSSSYVYVDRVQIAVKCSSISVWDDEPTPSVSDCDTVDNPDFETDDTWTRYSPNATIADSVLTLTPGDVALQNLDTQPNTTYNAVISVTQVTNGPVDLNVSLGEDYEILSVSGGGRYTSTLTTPNVNGPHQYALWNQSDQATNANIQVDFTCVYLETSSGQVECIAPTDGEFNTPNYWNWYRGANWNGSAKNAALPFVGESGVEADKALILSTQTYTMPTLETGEYLLFSFDAETKNDFSGVLAAVLQGGANNASGYFEVYPDTYTFEFDVSALAGQNETLLAFSNSGLDPLTDFTAEDDIHLDNVCVFVSDRPARLPGPVDPDPGAIGPVRFNFSYGCEDAPGILASYGVNMNLHHSVLGGSIVTDWWQWLLSGWWVMLESLLCWLLVALSSLVAVIEYGINNFLNVANWGVRETNLFLAFISSLWAWGLSTTGNLSVWWLNALIAILGWWLASGQNTLSFLGDLFDFQVENLNTILVWLAPFFNAILAWIAPMSLLPGLFVSVWDLLVMLFTWIWDNVFMIANLPIRFYYGFNDGVQSEAFSYLLNCSDGNFWCTFLAGVQIINQSVGHSILYPIVITCIIVATIVIIYRAVSRMASTQIT